jgi:hypothetical protein
MIYVPKFRIARVPADIPTGRRALPAYLEVRWFRWRKIWWLGPRIYIDGTR